MVCPRSIEVQTTTILNAVHRHWPIGLLYDYHTVNTTFISAKSAKMPAQAGDIGQPLQLTLHLRDLPLEKIPIGPSLDACRANFMNMVKEADFVRWGSTRRVTALRKVDQDALWEGIVRRESVSQPSDYQMVAPYPMRFR